MPKKPRIWLGKRKRVKKAPKRKFGGFFPKAKQPILETIKKLKEEGRIGKSTVASKKDYEFLEVSLWRCTVLDEKTNKHHFDRDMHIFTSQEKNITAPRIRLIRAVFEKLVKDFSKGGKYASD